MIGQNTSPLKGTHNERHSHTEPLMHLVADLVATIAHYWPDLIGKGETSFFFGFPSPFSSNNSRGLCGPFFQLWMSCPDLINPLHTFHLFSSLLLSSLFLGLRRTLSSLGNPSFTTSGSSGNFWNFLFADWPDVIITSTAFPKPKC